MNASNIIQRAGLATQTVVGGETLTFFYVLGANTSVSVKALVNRNIIKGRDFMRLFKDYAGDFEVLGLTEIEIDKNLVTTMPEAGMYFADAFGYKHRVRYITQTPTAWMVYCTPSTN